MEKYAKVIQSVQKDMGIKTSSFPHLGIYGDGLILNNKQGKRIVFEDHSALKKKQEKYEKWRAENAKKIEEALHKPDKDEVFIEFADDVGPYEKQECEETVPDLLEPDEDEEEIVITDEIPFRKHKLRIPS